MEFKNLSVFALFCLALVGTYASQSAEDYWQSVWPDTPLPKALSDLSLPYSGTNVPIRAEEEKQYWTVFFEHDLYPGKHMSIGLHKHSDIHHFEMTVRPSGKPSQPFGLHAWKNAIKIEGDGLRPFGKPSQPFGFHVWEDEIKTERDSLNDFCGSPAAIGEDKCCAPSFESMIDLVISKLGTTKIKVVSSSFAQDQDHYVVEEVKRIGDKAVMCHRLNFEKVVFYCHQVNATTIYMVPLVASDGTKAKAVAVCHHDTRGMNPDVLYEVLKVKPGTVPVCHFIGNKAVAWVPNPVVSESEDHPCVI